MTELAVSLISMMFFQIAAFYSFKKLSGKSIKVKLTDVILIIFNFAVQIIAFEFNMKIFANAFNILYFYFMFQLLYKCSKEEAKNYGIIIWLFCITLDLVVMLIFNVFDLFKYYEVYPALSKTIGSLCMSFMLIIASSIPPFLNHYKKCYTKISKLNIPIKYITIIITVLLALGFMELKFIKNDTIISLIFIIAVLVMVLIVHIIAEKYKIMVLKLTNKLLEENNVTNKKVITEYSILKHNFESKLMGIRDVANKETQELIDDLLEDTNSSVYIKNDINAMPLGINGIVMGKLAKHQDNKINISITNDITSNILDVVTPRGYNMFCEALGVSLDNALESAKNTKEKIVYMEFKETNDAIKIIIINTFSGAVDLDSLGEVNYTSKKKGHGLGLYSLLKRKLNITTTIKNNLFINDISIKKRQVKSE